MTIHKRAGQAGATVYFDPDECDVFMKLASDAEKASGSGEAPLIYTTTAQSYFSLSFALGRKMRALAKNENPAIVRRTA
jgi:hypothetical protein